MYRQIKQLRKLLYYDEIEYAYGEFHFRIGTELIPESSIKDQRCHKVLNKVRTNIQRIGISEMLIGRN